MRCSPSRERRCGSGCAASSSLQASRFGRFSESGNRRVRALVAGYGVAVFGDSKTGGTLRVARLAVTLSNSIQMRLVDPIIRGEVLGVVPVTVTLVGQS